MKNSDKIRITRLCKKCGKVHTIELRHNQFEDLLKYQANKITKGQDERGADSV